MEQTKTDLNAMEKDAAHGDVRGKLIHERALEEVTGGTVENYIPESQIAPSKPKKIEVTP